MMTLFLNRFICGTSNDENESTNDKTI